MTLTGALLPTVGHAAARIKYIGIVPCTFVVLVKSSEQALEFRYTFDATIATDAWTTLAIAAQGKGDARGFPSFSLQFEDGL